MHGKLTQGTVIVFVGTSGSGRKTIARRIGEELGIAHVLSYTTREPRPNEREGRDYHFIPRATFVEADIRGEFIQTADIDNCYYAIKRTELEAALRDHGTVYVIVNRSGANKLKYEFGARALRIFIYASKQSILERLEARDVSDEVVGHYMDHYIEEVSYRKECEHVFENLDLGATTALVKTTILSHTPAPIL